MEKIKEKQDQVDVVIVGTGVAGLFAALNLPRDFKIMMITGSRVDYVFTPPTILEQKEIIKNIIHHFKF